jgi:hypothetical protein
MLAHGELRMKVYVSGAITSDPNYKEKFTRAKAQLLARGYDVISPVDVGEYAFLTYDEFMHIDYALIDVCDAIFMLGDWQRSKGARMELQYAADYRKEILYQCENTREPNFPIMYGHPVVKLPSLASSDLEERKK